MRTFLQLFCTFILFFALLPSYAQQDRVKIFKDTRIVNSNSVEMIPQGTMKFIISHRFGELSSGVQELFGLDNATIRIGLDYAILNNLTIGLGRSSFEKHYDFYLKYRLLQQTVEGNSPVSLVFYTNAAIKTVQNAQTEDLEFGDKLSYVYQVLLARQFNENISLQFMPTMVHRNFVTDLISNNDIFSLGMAGRFQISKRVAINLEYYYLLPDQLQENFRNSAGLGIELETKGHIFQLNFSNSIGLIAPLYVAETTGDISKGNIHFGFNITRDFKIGSRNY